MELISRKNTGLTLFVELGPEQTKYVCATASREKSAANQLSVTAVGSLETSENLAGVVAEITSQKQKPKQLVLLLPRSEFEVSSYQLPQVEENDIPQLISNLVSESMETMEFTTDFILNTRADSEGKNALTWTLTNEVLDGFRAQAKQHGMHLGGVTSHTIGSIALWRNLVKSKSPHAVIVTIASQLIDFSVIYNHEVTHIRTIPFLAEDVEQISSRLISELQRTVAITGDSEESESTRVYLFGSPEERKPIAEALTEEFDVPVSILNPIDNTQFKADPLTVAESEEFAHLIGAAKAHFFDKLDVDLISPKRAAVKTLPWRRIAVWAVLGISLLGFGSFAIWDGAAQQQEEISEKRKQFDDLAKVARRVIEMKDELAAIRAWRNSEVIWLDELDKLSRQLPPREQSLIRRISMAVADNGETKIDLSVEVSDNTLVAGLENAIRIEGNKVTSKRVSESSDRTGEKWNFETSIRFVAQPPKLSFVAKEEDSQDSAVSENADPDSKTKGNADKKTSNKEMSNKEPSESQSKPLDQSPSSAIGDKSQEEAK